MASEMPVAPRASRFHCNDPGRSYESCHPCVGQRCPLGKRGALLQSDHPTPRGSSPSADLVLKPSLQSKLCAACLRVSSKVAFQLFDILYHSLFETLVSARNISKTKILCSPAFALVACICQRSSVGTCGVQARVDCVFSFSISLASAVRLSGRMNSSASTGLPA